MPAYQQMGHHTENLLFDPGLDGFRGAILSPVNYDFSDTQLQINRCREDLADFDLLFDPQLYYPTTNRGVLDRWQYFPTDVDTADHTSERWWNTLIERLAETAGGLTVDGLCSPTVVPRIYSDEFYSRAVDVAGRLAKALEPQGKRTLQTALVPYEEAADEDRIHTIGSILTRGDLKEIYLVVVGGGEPRRELSDTESLKGIMRLISDLDGAGMSVLVGFASADLLLWKAAGARSCAAGKFFNLRRFTSSRFDEPAGGGGQLPYWFEESLLAFLRESDIERVSVHELLADPGKRNPFAGDILRQLKENPGEAWVALGWRQFMYWFAEIERRLEVGSSDPRELLKEADVNWLLLDEQDVWMEERRNNGSWIRPWMRALAEFRI